MEADAGVWALTTKEQDFRNRGSQGGSGSGLPRSAESQSRKSRVVFKFKGSEWGQDHCAKPRSGVLWDVHGMAGRVNGREENPGS